MTEKELQKALRKISGCDDFQVLFRNVFNEDTWGEYYYKHRYIVLFVRDEYGEQYDDETLIRVACHELAHHIQYHHIEGYEPKKGEEHDEVFIQEFDKLLGKYYNGRVPSSTLEFIKGEGYLYEPKRKKKRLPRRTRKVYAQTTNS